MTEQNRDATDYEEAAARRRDAAGHTPGPWEYDPAGDSDGESVGVDHFVVARGGTVELCCPAREADARLIAAAPDLLAACKEFTKALATMPCDSTWDEQIKHTNPAFVMAEAAIAKAGG